MGTINMNLFAVLSVATIACAVKQFHNTNLLRKSQIVRLQSLFAQVLLQLQIGHFSMVLDLLFLQRRFAEYFVHKYFIKK